MSPRSSKGIPGTRQGAMTCPRLNCRVSPCGWSALRNNSSLVGEQQVKGPLAGGRPAAPGATLIPSMPLRKPHRRAKYPDRGALQQAGFRGPGSRR